ncbi:MAG: hypothetical protein R2816_06775 [Flavobacteriaceae bacterium]|nr:hypothetical protein [Flavobacteriaceae bacterium]
METLKFKVVIHKPVNKNFSLEEMQQIKVHEDYLIEESTINILYNYKPTSAFNKENFVAFMLKHLKKKYLANEVSLEP